ncbi:hypothetical protein GCM10017673_40930 [Streptosporangium violaceochromogenes]|nr:hypothetical protein GCM10017673_40930 [Streptosporangium violaceochromogenes]
MWGGQFRLDLTNDDIAKSRREGYGFHRPAEKQAMPEGPNAAHRRVPRGVSGRSRPGGRGAGR